MLLKPSINIENITRLADFIESGQVLWNYTDCGQCYLGQCTAILGVTLSLYSPPSCDSLEQYHAAIEAAAKRDTYLVANFLALSFDDADWLCWHAFEKAKSRSEAVSILRELAATGRLPTEVET